MDENKNGKQKNRIQELYDEVEAYKQAIQEARYALASAEMELDEALDAEHEKCLN